MPPVRPLTCPTCWARPNAKVNLMPSQEHISFYYGIELTNMAFMLNDRDSVNYIFPKHINPIDLSSAMATKLVLL